MAKFFCVTVNLRGSSVSRIFWRNRVCHIIPHLNLHRRTATYGESIFEGIIKELFVSAAAWHVIHDYCFELIIESGEDATCEVQLTLDEANVLRYACGFVGMKLHKKFLKIKGVKAVEFTECLKFKWKALPQVYWTTPRIGWSV